MWGFGYGAGFGGFGGFGRGHKKAAKPKKKPAENFFEKLKVEQLTELLRASKQPVSGTKAVLIGRLLSHPATAFYGQEARAASYTAGFGLNPGRDGTSVDSLKEDCRAKGLRVTGNNYDLMLRLLQAEHGVGNPKRAANVEVGKFCCIL
jgi:hypothetical protein